MLAPDMVLQNRYRIVRPIAQGGMGAVYMANDQRLHSVVAIKETFYTDERWSKAFEREAELLANLHHPALPNVTDHLHRKRRPVFGDAVYPRRRSGRDACATEKRLLCAHTSLGLGGSAT
ncbi:MAG: hypothetical protein WKF84_15465 [Pyrinomonadaceae bacterium]